MSSRKGFKGYVWGNNAAFGMQQTLPPRPPSMEVPEIPAAASQPAAPKTPERKRKRTIQHVRVDPDDEAESTYAPKPSALPVVFPNLKPRSSAPAPASASASLPSTRAAKRSRKAPPEASAEIYTDQPESKDEAEGSDMAVEDDAELQEDKVFYKKVDGEVQEVVRLGRRSREAELLQLNTELDTLRPVHLSRDRTQEIRDLFESEDLPNSYKAVYEDNDLRTRAKMEISRAMATNYIRLRDPSPNPRRHAPATLVAEWHEDCVTIIAWEEIKYDEVRPSGFC